MHKPHLDEAERAKIVKLAESGMTQADIARRMGRSPQAVGNVVRAAREKRA